MVQDLPNGYRGDIPVGADDWGGDVNDNMRKWATLSQLSVVSMSLRSPPSPRVINAVYIVPTNPTGDWSQFANQIVFWDGNMFVRYLPSQGLLAFDQSRGAYYKYQGNAWVPLIPPFVGVACNLDSGYTISTLNTYSRVPFNANGCTVSAVGINPNISANDYYFTQGGFYQAHFAAEINNNSATGKGISGRIVIAKHPNFNEVIVAESASVVIISNADNLQRIGVQMSGLFSVDANDSINFQVSGSQGYTIVPGPRTRFSVHKVG